MKKHTFGTIRRLFALLICMAMLLPMIPAPTPVSAAASGMENAQSVVDQVRSLYSGGTKSNSLALDCGGGLTGNGEKSYMTIVTGTTATHFKNFQTSLKNAGYQVRSERTLASNSSDNNSFGDYTSPDGSCRVYTYFLPDYKETRIIVDTEAATVEGYRYTAQPGKTVEPKLVQWGLSMAPNGSSSNEQKNWGSLTVLLMPDNSLFIHDGGDVQQWNDEACDAFLSFCRELTGTKEGQKMVINTWFMSHAHHDHFRGFYRFLNKHHSQFDLKNVMYNIDTARSGENYDISGLLNLIRSAYPNVRYYNPHTGESIKIGGVTLDVIYTLEDRFVPNSSNKLIIDDENLKGGTYRDGMYKDSSAKTYDFNDTSTVIRLTFANGVNTILYADATRAKSIYTTYFPTSYLSTDIMMVPHHGHNEHADLVSYANAKVYLYTQHKNAAYGPDDDVTTIDFYRHYNDSVRTKFLTMFPDMNVSKGTTPNVTYRVFWAGTETVTIDINALANTTNAYTATNYYTTQPALNFDYTGWLETDLYSEPNLEDLLLGTADDAQETQAVTSVTNRYNPVASGGLKENARYVIKHEQMQTVMSYDAVAKKAGTPNTATSFWPTSENPADPTRADLYYESEKGIYLDHSNRALAMWILHQEGKADDASLSKGPLDAMFGGKAYGEVWLNKGNATEWDSSGNKTSGRNGVYWTAVYGNDSKSPATQYRYLDPRYDDAGWVTTSEPTGTDSSDPKKRYIVEDLGDGTFVVYWRSVSGATMGFLTCDEAGNWGIKMFTNSTSDEYPSVPTKGSAELDALKLRFYNYTTFTDIKSIQFSGPKTYEIMQGATQDDVVSIIQKSIALTDTTRHGLRVPCNGTSSKIGYCYLKFSKSVSTTSAGTYTVQVLFRNDDNTDTQITTLTVDVVEDPYQNMVGSLTLNKNIQAGQTAGEYVLTLEAYADAPTVAVSGSSNTVVLDANAVISDNLSDYFVLSTGDAKSVEVYTAAYTGTGAFTDDSSFGSLTKLSGAKVQLSASQTGGSLDTVTVSGFDYQSQFLSEKVRDSGFGSKLVIKITLRTLEGFWGGNNIPAGKSPATLCSSSGQQVTSIPVSEVNVAPEIVVETLNKTIYYGGNMDLNEDGYDGDDLFDCVTIGGVEVTVSNNGLFTPAEDWMDDFATAQWADGSTKPNSILNNTTAADYAFTVQINPRTSGISNVSDSRGAVFGEALIAPLTSGFAHVYMLVPGLTFQDATANFCTPTEDYNYPAFHYVRTEWLFQEDGADATKAPPAYGAPPMLDINYIPNSSTLADGMFVTDTKVDVIVLADGKDITGLTTFYWEDCDHSVTDVLPHNGNANFNEFWVHVSASLLPDTVVIDYDLDVVIDVLANDPQIDGFEPSLSGIGPKFATSFTATTVEGEYGKLIVDGTSVRYVLDPTKALTMDKEEVFTYQAVYVVNAEMIFGTASITILPATSIYFEDNATAVKYHTNVDTPYDTLASWTPVGTQSGNTQQEDRPGISGIYGQDSGAVSPYFSNGISHKVMVSRNADGSTVNARATFSFTGTGFDIASLCAGAAGTVTVKVYEEDSFDQITFDGPSATTPVLNHVVQTQCLKDGVTLYQVPIIKVDMNQVATNTDANVMCGYGTYTVEIYITPGQDASSGGYTTAEFYLDGIRIYNTMPKDNFIANSTYLADGEAWPSYLQLRNMLADSTAELGSTGLNKLLFIEGGKYSNTLPVIKAYQSWGPNGEIYLGAGQSLAFTLDAENYAADIAEVHLAMRGAATQGNVLITAVDLSTKAQTVLMDTQLPVAEQFYDISGALNKLVIISNKGTTPIAVSTMKITHTAEPSVSGQMLLMMSQADASLAQEVLRPENYADPVLKPKYPALSFNGMVCYNIFFTAEDLGYLTEADLGLAVFSTKDTEGTVDTAMDVIMGATLNDGLYMVATNGIHAKYLGDMLYFKVFARLADGSYVYSKMVNYSALTYANNALKSNDVKLKQLVVAMLNYGAEAQLYFDYKTDNLINKNLTAEQQALVSGFSAALLNPVGKVDSAKVGAFTNTGGFSKKNPAISFKGAFEINYFFTPANPVDNGMTLYIWTEDTYNSASRLTLKNADTVVDLELQSDGRYAGASHEIAARYLDKTVYVAAVYTSGGVTYCSGVLPYSIAAYCKNPPFGVQELATAAAIYGCAAKQYFG